MLNVKRFSFLVSRFALGRRGAGVDEGRRCIGICSGVAAWWAGMLSGVFGLALKKGF